MANWLNNQRKGDLLELADKVGLENYEAYKKPELASALDSYLADNETRFATNPDLTGYFNSRSRSLGSPVKRELRKEDEDHGIKVPRRRPAKPTKLSEEITPESDEQPEATSTALIQTPARSLSQVAARIPLPATPADVAQAVDRSTQVVRQRVSSLYEESGITEISHSTRAALSTVTSVLFSVALFEIWNIRPEILTNTFAFTFPAIEFLGTSDIPVYVPDMFLLLTSSFWAPAWTWAFTSAILPSLLGYYFNLSIHSGGSSGRRRSVTRSAEYVVDPLTFSIVKALLSYVVYAEGATFYGLLSESSIPRLNNAVYGGYKGMLVGTAITGLVSIYDAVLRK